MSIDLWMNTDISKKLHVLRKLHRVNPKRVKSKLKLISPKMKLYINWKR